MISLRRLEVKDVPYMLDWMHDSTIQPAFIKDMSGVSSADAEAFCKASDIPEIISEGDNLHFAIVDEKDEYLGTISLKEIDLVNGTTEFAIATRSCVHGKGVATEAMKLVLQKAFGEYGLHRVFLYVLDSNITAIKYYEKCGFQYEGRLRKHLLIDGEYHDWLIYGILSEEFENE